jgi:hypothetical protein
MATDAASMASTRRPSPPIVVWNVLVVTPLMPKRFGSCAAMMTSDIAAVKPTSTGCESRSARNPRRSAHASSMIAATPSARTAASSVARATSPCAIGAMAAAVRIELVDVGPTCAWRSEPANP